LDGKIIAPTTPGAWKSGLLQWIEFTKLNGITIQGKGIIDGQGSVWWNNLPTNNLEDSEVKDAIKPSLSIPSKKLYSRQFPFKVLTKN
jgi:polygalacturonase